MLCVDIMRQAGDISDAEWNFFLRGAAAVDKVRRKTNIIILCSLCMIILKESGRGIVLIIIVVPFYKYSTYLCSGTSRETRCAMVNTADLENLL